MHQRRRLAVHALTLTLALGAAGALGAQETAERATDRSYPGRCAAGIPPAEARGYVPLPRGDVFCPLIADPKGMRSFVSYLRGDDADFATNVGSVGIADDFGFFRVGGGTAGNGVQLGVDGGVFAQFDLGTSSYDLINADYLIGFPLTMRRGGFSSRLRVYHQSSHLGDEYLLRAERPDRENLGFEALEVLLSQDLAALRVYAGGEYFLNREPETLPQKLLHGGVELRPSGALGLGSVGSVRLVAAADAKAIEEEGDWNVAVSARAGIEVGRPRDDATAPSRRWSLLFEYYDGQSPYGQFFLNDVRLVGVGFHFTP